MINNGKCLLFIKFSKPRRFFKLACFYKESQNGMPKDALVNTD